MNLLIVTPSFKILGGVANHYQGLAPYWKDNVRYLFYGKRTRLPAFITMLPDYLHYLFLLFFTPIDIVIVNPSLHWYQLYRDCIYSFSALIFKKNVVTMIHGWDDKVADKLIKEKPWWFKRSFGKSKFIYVLFSGFKKKLEKMGIAAPVLLTTTKVSDGLVKGFDISIREGGGKKIEEILFLARIDRKKGIMTTIDTFFLLKKSHPYLKLSVCGTGPALQDAENRVRELNLTDVTFYGNVSGKAKIKRFESADLYVLPTTHGEGMATSILEAMAFGLPVISRPVGGVVDFWENGKMGFLTESTDAKDYALLINKLINDSQLTKQMSIFNHKYAIDHFLASKVTDKYEKDINTFCK